MAEGSQAWKQDIWTRIKEICLCKLTNKDHWTHSPGVLNYADLLS